MIVIWALMLIMAGVIAIALDAHYMVVFMLFFWAGFMLYHAIKEPGE